MLKQWKLVGGVLIGLLLTSLVLVFIQSPVTQAQGNNPVTINCSALTGGQATGTSNNVTLAGTLGQWAASNPTGGATQLSSGFWPPALADCGKKTTPTPPLTTTNQVFLPNVIKSDSDPELTHLFIISVKTGGIDPLRITDPDNNNVEVHRCTVPNQDNVPIDCSHFPAIGRYTLIAHTINCGVLQGTFDGALPGAIVTRTVRC